LKTSPATKKEFASDHGEKPWAAQNRGSGTIQNHGCGITVARGPLRSATPLRVIMNDIPVQDSTGALPKGATTNEEFTKGAPFFL
jgi:hypothetical protein